MSYVLKLYEANCFLRIEVVSRVIQDVAYCCELCKEIYFTTFNVLLIELVCSED